MALVAADGTLLAAVHGPSISHQAVGLEAALANLRALVAQAGTDAGIGRDGARPVARIGSFCVAGADFPSDVRMLHRAIAHLGLVDDLTVRNDTFGALRAGTDRPWGVVLICGRGINGAGIAPNGASARFDALGHISGDWGGGRGIGTAAHAASVRARDGRGPRTVFEHLVPEHFGLKTPAAVTRALYDGRIPDERLAELAPVVFRGAAMGDAVARGILTRLSTELATMAAALIRRLHLTRFDPEVVLAGSVFHGEDATFYAEIADGIHAVAPRASIVHLTAPPVLGAALLGLDGMSTGGATPPDVDARLRIALTAWRGRRSPGGDAAASGTMTA